MTAASDRTLIGVFADDLFLHGHHLTRWITDYVDIEESLAVGSLAQEEMAHAATLLELAGISSHDRDWRIFVRPAEQWCPSQLTTTADGDWAEAVARGFYFTWAVAVLFKDLRATASGVHDRMDVMAAEQDLHRMHWERWVRILARDPAMSEHFGAVLVHQAGCAADLFGVTVDPSGPGSRAGHGSGPDAQHEFGPQGEHLHGLWVESVASTLDALGAPAVPLALHPSPRRPGVEDGPVGDTLRSLRAVRIDHPERVYPVH